MIGKRIYVACMRMTRTEMGKRLRKAYENHEIECGYNEHRTAEPRPDDICNTITTIQKDYLLLEVWALEKLNILGALTEEGEGNFSGRKNVYGTDGMAPALTTMGGGDRQPKIVTCVAMRGRNPDNPSDRTAGIPTEQRLEVKKDETVNTLTTVQKDNLIIESSAIIDDRFRGSRDARVYGECSPTLSVSSCDEELVVQVATNDLPENLKDWVWEIDGQRYLIRIRKLTPKECWRLMDFADEDYAKAEQEVSQTQLYKQAGNSIVKNVLCEVFRQLIE